MFWRRGSIIAALAFALAAFAGTSEARVIKSPADLNCGPRVVSYDVKKDQFMHQESVLSRPWRRPGGDISYSGSRLKQYQFIGKPGRGGIYDALQENYDDLKLAPKRYEYRGHH
ncbi:MAG TPA: hypothetical protein VMV10_26870 [Pirellulales bacterium]|nr:hypothetical protein [Pirellulales bacterium]